MLRLLRSYPYPYAEYHLDYGDYDEYGGALDACRQEYGYDGAEAFSDLCIAIGRLVPTNVVA